MVFYFKIHKKMNGKEKVQLSLNHQQGQGVAIDFGGTPVTGIHVLAIKNLRDYYGLENRPVKVVEPYQMLGEVDAELQEIMGVDTISVPSRKNMFGIENSNYKEFKTFWGQTVLVPGDFNTEMDQNGDLIIFPEGDMKAKPSAKMPKSSYFFDSIIRQGVIDDNNLSVEDNLEEFKQISADDLNYLKTAIENASNSNRAVVANMGGTALGDIALVPAPFMKSPRGIRDVTEWYMSLMMRPDYVKEIFEKQTEIAVQNLQKLFDAVGNKIDVIFICGTDFGTQDSQFCDPQTFDEIYKPYYRKVNDWIHQNTSWKTFKHSCGAIEPLMQNIIESGFDIINPVQINAKGMDSKLLKEKYGSQITFWGGGVDTQKTLAFGTPADVEKQVLEQCQILSQNGGFIFNTVHNIQANVPINNLVAMINALKKFNGK